MPKDALKALRLSPIKNKADETTFKITFVRMLMTQYMITQICGKNHFLKFLGFY